MGGAVDIGVASGGRYREIRKLGAGATAEVHLVEEIATRRVWVGKRYRLSQAASWKEWELFERGARVLEGLDHPGIPRFRELLRHEGPRGPALWAVEEYLPGRSLREVVAEGGPLDPVAALRVARGLVALLDHLHTRAPPIVHRDVKPSNVLLQPDGRVALVDFGAVQQAAGQATLGGSTVVGTYGYMPPEQYMGRAEPASDLYAAGGVLLWLLTGREPADYPVRDVRLDLGDVAAGWPRLRELLDGLLEPRLEARLAPAREVLRALAGLLAAGPPPARRPPATPGDVEAFVARAAPAGPVLVLGPGEVLAAGGGGICPTCDRPLDVIRLEPEADVPVEHCAGCGGLWVAHEALVELAPRPILTRPDLAEIGRRLAAMKRLPDVVAYRPCPRCRATMRRQNFGRLSGIVVDECPAHGVWLDPGELEGIREFLRLGGAELADRVERASGRPPSPAAATPEAPLAAAPRLLRALAGIFRRLG